MILTSNGRAFVYGVFGADGCECENLEALFGNEDDALAYKRRLAEHADAHGNCSITGDPTLWFYGYAKFLTVRPIELFGETLRSKGSGVR